MWFDFFLEMLPMQLLEKTSGMTKFRNGAKM